MFGIAGFDDDGAVVAVVMEVMVSLMMKQTLFLVLLVDVSSYVTVNDQNVQNHVHNLDI